jgi:hypothetical protein
MLDTPSPSAIEEPIAEPVVVRDPLYTPEAIAERKRLINMRAEDITREISITSTFIHCETRGVAAPDWDRVRALITRKAGYGILLRAKQGASK